jgi:hypothetical protein
VAVNGFLFDMPQLFEGFITVALREGVVPAYGGLVAGQDWVLRRGGTVTLKPDIVWKIHRVPSPSSTPSTSPRNQLLPNADLPAARLLHVLGLPNGQLVYASGRGTPRHTVRHQVQKSTATLQTWTRSRLLYWPDPRLVGRIAGPSQRSVVNGASPRLTQESRNRVTEKICR